MTAVAATSAVSTTAVSTTAAPTTAGRISPRRSLDRVVDPEIPVLTIADLGILRDVVEHPDGSVEVVITPTYSGCPAMEVIAADVRTALADDGYPDVTITTVFSPAWTTDWMTDSGRRTLREYGIAPPARTAPSGPVSLTLRSRRPAVDVRCPRCGGPGRELSRFGSTACKSAWVCTACAEPFDHFKAI